MLSYDAAAKARGPAGQSAAIGRRRSNTAGCSKEVFADLHHVPRRPVAAPQPPVQYHQVHSYHDLNEAHASSTDIRRLQFDNSNFVAPSSCGSSPRTRGTNSFSECMSAYTNLLSSLLERFLSRSTDAEVATSALAQCSRTWMAALLGTQNSADVRNSTLINSMPTEQLRDFSSSLLECASLQAAAFSALHELLASPSNKPAPDTIGAFLSEMPLNAQQNNDLLSSTLHHLSHPPPLPSDALRGVSMSSSAFSSSSSDGTVPGANEGLHVPQLDLDALLGPPGSDTHQDKPTWRKAARRAVRRTAAAPQGRARSKSSLSAAPSRDAIDLRPEWMRNAALANALMSPQIASLKPYAYVEWNIVGFHRVIEERRGPDRIVSPEILFRPLSAAESRGLFPIRSLRMMVTIKRGENENKVGVEFTVAEAVDILYRIVYPNHVCDAKWHSFKDKPWAGISCEESTLAPVQPPIVLSVGVLIETVRPAAAQTLADHAGSKDSSSSSLLRRCKLVDGSETDLRRSSGSPRKWEEVGGRVRSFSDWPEWRGTTAQAAAAAASPVESSGMTALPSLGNLIASLSDGMSRHEISDLLSQFRMQANEDARRHHHRQPGPLPFQKTLSRMQLTSSGLAVGAAPAPASTAGPPLERNLLSQIWNGQKL